MKQLNLWDEKAIDLNSLKDQINTCKNCKLCETPGKHVPGEGNPNSQIVFLGEGPGATERELGRPFVGRAGKLLDNMLKSVSLTREDIYILNTVCCGPPGNRKPLPEEMEICKPFLVKQLEIIKPIIIVALGNTALEALTGIGTGITKRCGNWEETDILDYKIKVLPQYHPAFLLRNPAAKEQAWYTMQKLTHAMVVR